jgi:hypothetical protein
MTTPDVAMAVERLTEWLKHCDSLARPADRPPNPHAESIRLVLAHLTALSARNKQLADLLREAERYMSTSILVGPITIAAKITAALAAEEDRK